MGNHTIAIDREIVFLVLFSALFAGIMGWVMGYQSACGHFYHERDERMQEQFERDRAREHERVRDEERKVFARLGIED